MLRKITKKGILTVMLLAFCIGTLSAQVSNKSDLFQAIKAKDYEIFTLGFNQCNVEKVGSLTHRDFEFYHDKDGITGSKESFVEIIENDLCSSGKNVISRVLDENSLQVFPMYKDGEMYGAIQTGSHSFGNTNAQFTHLWLLQEGSWKLSRVMSFNHHTQTTTLSAEEDLLSLTANDLKKYLGGYQFSPEFVLSIVQENGKLYGDSQGEKVEIKPYEEHKFIAIDNSVKLRFEVDSSGNATGLVMITPEGEMPAQKIN